MSEKVAEMKVMDAAVKTVDGFDNFVSRLGLNNDNTLSAGFYTFNLMTENRVQLEAAYRGSWIVGQVIDTKAEDMTRAGIDITSNDDDGDIKKIQAKISQLKIWRSLCSAIKWGDLYGGCIAVYQVKGQDLASPLDIETVGKGQFLGLAVFDRWQLQPNLGELIEEGPDMGLPKYYQIVTTASMVQPTQPSPSGMIKVHHSRLIRMTGIELPFFQAITEQLWGESVLERLWDRLIAFDSATMSAANLIERANNRTVGIENLREIISNGGAAYAALNQSLDMMRLLQSNEGLTLLDKNDTFVTNQYTFTGLPELLMQFGQQVSGASEIPLVRLFGQSPAGMNATGESDIRMYYDHINSEQEAKMRPGIDKLLRILWRSVFGKAAPEDLEFTFTALWQMSALDQATIAKSNTETILGANTDGLIKASTAMKELRDMSGDVGLFSNITDEEIAEADELADLAPDPILNPLDPKAAETDKDPDPDQGVVKNLDHNPFKRWMKRWKS